MGQKLGHLEWFSADGWTDGWMDGRTNGQMDGHSLIEMLGRIEKEKENLLLAETCVWQMD